jgi:EH_Signature domain
MESLSFLRSILCEHEALETRLLTPFDEIDGLLDILEGRARSAGNQHVPLDLQRQAVQRFWQSMRLDTLREGRLVSFGMCLPSEPDGPCILEDSLRFSKLLDGVDQWVKEPRRYRRCYRGLITNYFGYDVLDPQTPASGRQNWITLRQYLGDRLKHITDSGINPGWVTCAVEHHEVFGHAPCNYYAPSMLRGETDVVDGLRVNLGIDDSSWFVRELVLAQVIAAVEEADDRFKEHLPRLLAMLESNLVFRDRGLVLLLDRYTRIASRPIHQNLRDCAVAWWGNPWLTSNTMRWGAVQSSTRAMVTEWLKLEFIEAFFTLLAEEGVGDRRRLEFWKRYVHAITEIHFALGADARSFRSRDFVELRKKMLGLTVELQDTVSSNNAFVMTMGDLVVVEFSGRANALYGYDARRGRPFEMTQPVVSTKNARNSLKNSNRLLWLKHQDGIHGWDRWEEMFAATLKKNWGIEPQMYSSVTPPSPAPVPPQTGARNVATVSSNATSWASTSYSWDGLRKFAEAHGLEVDDRGPRGGSLWVRATSSDVAVDRVLSAWGFRFKPGKGWWK